MKSMRDSEPYEPVRDSERGEPVRDSGRDEWLGNIVPQLSPDVYIDPDYDQALSQQQQTRSKRSSRGSQGFYGRNQRPKSKRSSSIGRASLWDRITLTRKQGRGQIKSHTILSSSSWWWIIILLVICLCGGTAIAIYQLWHSKNHKHPKMTDE